MKTENKTNHYIDLHAHLDGCITVDIAKKLAALQQITLPAATDEELLSLLSVPDTCENLNDFLKCFDLPLSLLQTEEALEEAKKYEGETFVIGGESIYRAMLKYCDTALVTKIDHAYDADTYFPSLDEDPEWKMTKISEEQTCFDLEYYFTVYERI